MNKICTTLEQSQKLIELGININTADMWYQHIGYSIKDGITKPVYFPMVMRDDPTEKDIPAWSLSALLSLLKPCDGETYTMRGTFDGGATIEFSNITNVMTQEDNPLDAVFEMVVWLKENSKI